MRREILLGAASALALVACGSSVGGGNGGNGGGGSQCAAFADEASTTSVTVRFHNNTFQPVYLPNACTVVDYEIRPKGGDDGVVYMYSGGCLLWTCESAEESSPPTCGACPEQTYRIEPGSTLETTWDGRGLRPGVAMPSSCWAVAAHEATCSKLVVAGAGEYRVDALGYADCTGACTCDANGVCGGSPTGQKALPNPATFAFPTETAVDVVFDACAFGCPGGP